MSANNVVLLTILGLFILYTNGYDYKTKYITVPVDHFSFTINSTFKLRYLLNDTFWDKNGGPIFFYTGNEGAIEMFAQNTGFMWDIAEEFSALLVFAEHRYYGESLPFGNKSFSGPKYTGYLTSLQALADYVDLITSLKQQLSGAGNSSVITFGGSYGGMLSAWFRMKFPGVVDGAIASSAPIWQFTGLTPCEAFNRIVTSDFSDSSAECSKTIKKSWDVLRNMAGSDAGRKWLSENWHLCQPLNSTDDLKNLTDWLTNVYTNLAMVDYPYPADFLAPLPAQPVQVVCSHLTNSSVGDKDLMNMLYKGLNVYFNYTGKAKCLDVNTAATSDLGDKGWDYQACSEMVMPMCTDGENDMFEAQGWDIAKYSDDCYKKWKVRPQPDLIIKLYGGKNIQSASNIIFSNGLLDPWSSGGVLYNISDSVLAVIIPESAHHLDLRSSNVADPVSVVLARNLYRQVIRHWVTQHSEILQTDL